MRTHASDEAAGAADPVGAADAAGDAAATRAAVLPSTTVIAASRANFLNSLMPMYLSFIS
jgi:hypothetical protein